MDPQWERAHQAWSLHVDVDPAELTAVQSRTLFRILRVKRLERAGLLAKLPGVVRRGAHVDLESLQIALHEAGFACALREREERPGRG